MQTLYAMMALAAFGLLALTAQRQSQRVEERVAESEVETVALGVATGLLDRAAALPFDSAGTVRTVAALTPTAGFGGAVSPASALDLDDLHGLETTEIVTADGRPLEVDVDLAVGYVTRTATGFAPSPTPTPYKELRVEARGPLGRTYTLSRVYGCLFLGESR